MSRRQWLKSAYSKICQSDRAQSRTGYTFDRIRDGWLWLLMISGWQPSESAMFLAPVAMLLLFANGDDQS